MIPYLLTPIFWLRLRRYVRRAQDRTGAAVIVVLGGEVVGRAETVASVYSGEIVIASGMADGDKRILRGVVHPDNLIVDDWPGTTLQNAAGTWALLDHRGLPMRVRLVTDDWHMPRAMMHFGMWGIEVSPLHHVQTPRPSLWPEAHRWARDWWQS